MLATQVLKCLNICFEEYNRKIPHDGVWVKSKWILSENPVNTTMDLLQWKFQINFTTKVLDQYISKKTSIVYLRPF